MSRTGGIRQSVQREPEVERKLLYGNESPKYESKGCPIVSFRWELDVLRVGEAYHDAGPGMADAVLEAVSVRKRSNF